jgi:phage baseplate assembly protein V
MMDPTYFREIERVTEGIIRIGVVDSVLHDEGKCRVKLGDRLSHKLKFIAPRAGDDKVYWPPDVGEQVLILSPGGDDTAGFVLTGIFSNLKPLPEGAGENKFITEFKDGSRIEYDRESHRLKLDIQGDIVITATGDIRMESSGDVTIKGQNIHLNP